MENRRFIPVRSCLLMVLLLCCSMVVYGDAGVTNYSQGAQVLADMNTKFIYPISTSMTAILFAIGTILAFYSGTVVYIKLQTGDEGFLKSCLTLIGSILFLFASVEVIPGFFGEHGMGVTMGLAGEDVFDTVRASIEGYVVGTRQVILAIGAVVALVGSIRIYWKMNNQDQDIKQSIYVLVMACVFLLFVATSVPAFFGYSASSFPLI